MNSKTSFFNRTIFRKDVTRLWPVWALYSVLLFFALPFQAYLRLAEVRNLHSGTEFHLTHAFGADAAGIYFAISPVLICMMALLAANAVFGYLYSPKNTNMTHAFPVTRKELFATHYISGYLFLAVPQIVMFLAAMPGYRMQGFEVVREVLPGLVYALLIIFIFYSIAVLCCLLSGHIVASLAWYFIINAVYFTLRLVINIVVNGFCYGTTLSVIPENSRWDILFPGKYLIQYTGIDQVTLNELSTVENANAQYMRYTGWGIVLGYCAVAVILTALGMWMYRKRQLEAAGEMNAFGFLDPVVRVLASFCGGGIFGYVLALISSTDDNLHIVPFLIFSVLFQFIWYLVSAIILRKSFRVFGRRFWSEWAVITALSLVLIMTLIFKVSADREKEVPKAQDVRVAVMNCSYPIFADDEKEIEKITSLHQALIDNKEKDRKLYYEKSDYDETAEGGQFATVSIAYVLKNGKMLERSYPIWIDEESLRESDSSQTCLDKTEQDYEQVLAYIFSPKYEEMTFTGGSVSLDQKELGITAEAAEDIYEAVVQDIAQGHLWYRVSDGYRSSDDFDMNAQVVFMNLTGRADGPAANVCTPYEEELGRYKDTILNAYQYNEFRLMLPDTDTHQKASGKYETTYNCNLSINKECVNVLDAFERNGIEVPKDAFEP